jgi:hypothetical protein
MKSIYTLLLAYVLILLAILLLACNPVKQVLKDKKKFEQVAEVVIESGYCANDTTIITKSDTTIVHDTTYETDTVIDVKTLKDTQYVTLPKKVITRTITIRDTITNVVVDGARVLLLEKKLVKSEESRLKYEKLAKQRWWNLFWLILIFSIYILRKPILKFIRWQFVKF